MSLDSTMDKVLARRTEVENILNDAASLSVDEMANFARELSEFASGLRTDRTCPAFDK